MDNNGLFSENTESRERSAEELPDTSAVNGEELSAAPDTAEAELPADTAAADTADKAGEADDPKVSKLVTNIYELASIFMSAFIMLAIMFTFLFRVVGVIGQSMESTVFEGDWVITTQKEEYEQGDIVIITQPNYFNEPLIKRVIARGGQTIDIDYATSTVYVDGVELEEPYRNEFRMQANYDDRSFPYTVPDGCLFVMGDNRNHSTDSRSTLIGPIDERYILGRALVRILPFGDFNIYDYE